MSERRVFICKRCGHSIRLIVGLSNHGLLKYFDVINIDTIRDPPPFIRTVPTLFHNGKTVSGDELFDYMNDFAKKILTVNDKKEKNNTSEDYDAWCPGGGCSIGFSEISESDDNFKETFHRDFGEAYEILEGGNRVSEPIGDEDSNNKLDDFNKKYEDFVNSRK